MAIYPGNRVNSLWITALQKPAPIVYHLSWDLGRLLLLVPHVNYPNHTPGGVANPVWWQIGEIVRGQDPLWLWASDLAHFRNIGDMSSQSHILRKTGLQLVSK